MNPRRSTVVAAMGRFDGSALTLGLGAEKNVDGSAHTNSPFLLDSDLFSNEKNALALGNPETLSPQIRRHRHAYFGSFFVKLSRSCFSLRKPRNNFSPNSAPSTSRFDPGSLTWICVGWIAGLVAVRVRARSGQVRYTSVTAAFIEPLFRT